MRWRCAASGAHSVKQIEQRRVVRLVLGLLGRMRPVRTPHHALGRGLDVGLRNRGLVRVGRRAGVRVL